MNRKNRIKIRVNNNNTIQSSDALLVEYQAAQDFALHSDTISWQIGSVFIGGILILLGILLQEFGRVNSLSFYFGLLLAILALSIWYIFAQGQYQLMQMKLFRVREIEQKYDLQQNSGWEKKIDNNFQCKYQIFGMGGRILKKVLFIVISIFTNLLGAINIYTSFKISSSIEWNSVIVELLCCVISIWAFLYCQHYEKLFKIYKDSLTKQYIE